MTPAVNLVKKHQIDYVLHEYEHDGACQSYGLEAAQKLGVAPERVFKTLVVSLDNGQLAVGVLPVSGKMGLKQMAKFLGAKKAQMASQNDVERSTGYVLGGVSPLGQKKPLKTLIDASAQVFSTIFVSGGRRGLEIELPVSQLLHLTRGRFAQLCV